MHADRTNRLALTLFGLIVFLAGVAGLVASVGGFGKTFSRHTLFANRVSAYIAVHGDWLWPAAAAVCLLIALVALRWIAALLLSTDRAGDITITASGKQGTTIMHPAALTGAVSREIESYHGVHAAKARVLGDPRDLNLVVTVTADQSADLRALCDRIESQALSHVRQALGKPDLPIQLDLDVSRHVPERVS
jgi:hypothetical protein